MSARDDKKGSPLGFDGGGLIMCIRDDLNLGCIIDRLRAEGLLDVRVYTPDHDYNGDATPKADIEEIARVANSRSAQHVVLPVRNLDGSREEIETRIRNSTVEDMAHSFQWSLVVDSDELWTRGVGRILANAVKDNSERSSLRGRLIPYLGLPAYPVKTNSDTLLIGIRNDERFRSMRSVWHPESTVQIGPKLAYHFSGVRRSYADLVAKMRRSGHYNDKKYDFEGWIRDLLPNIKPGYAGRSG